MVGNAAKSMAQPDHLHFFDGIPTALQPQGAVEMTQKQILSVQNTETAIPIHHIPTFDEVYAMPYVRESLECILDQNIRQYQILYSFKDDLRQEILIHMNHELSNFDPEKSAIQTFARLTIISGMRIARRKYFTRKNYLLFSAQDLNLFENGDDHNVALNKDDCRAYASHSRNNIDWDSQSHDIDTVIAMMPQDLQKITRMLFEEKSVLQVCRRLGIANSTFRGRYLKQIRAIFNERFFQKNQKKPVN